MPIDIDTTCPTFAPCGGDVVGSWLTKSFCGVSTTEPSCSDLASSQTASGDIVYTFSADGTLTMSGSLSATIDYSITDACAMSSLGTDAAGYCALLTSLGDPSNPSLVIDCAFAGGTCNCHIVEGPAPLDQTDTYTAMGNQLIVGANSPSDYCIEGDTLTIRSNDGTQQTVLTRK
jgi:hypothetical protein